MTLANILFVDDEPRGVDSFLQELEFSNYKVVFKENIDAAEEYLQQHHEQIQLVILDIMMPSGEILKSKDTDNGMKTGLFFYKKIRNKFSDLPIIIFTNFSPGKQLKKNLDSDPKSLFIPKYSYLPFELVEEVQKFLNRI